MKLQPLQLLSVVAVHVCLAGCDASPSQLDGGARSNVLQIRSSLAQARKGQGARTRQLGPGGQRQLTNPEAIVPPQCYTRTEGRHNPCYVCHQGALTGEPHENRMNDGDLQGDYAFSDFALKNRWSNLFVDRTAAVGSTSDEEIRSYVAQDNWTPLLERMAADRAFQGWRPDLRDLARAAAAFDAEGFAKDGSGWVAFNYMPMPSTFWPTNGSTDDVMIRLPPEFRSLIAGGPTVRDVYAANLALLEASIKNMSEIGALPLDEQRVGLDLDGDGVLRVTRRVRRRAHYVGAASHVDVRPFLFPRGTEFLHTVRYVGTNSDGGIVVPPRIKEVRYMTKHTFIPDFALAGLYDDENQEKEEGNPPYYADFRDKGVDNGFGWLLQGYIEAADGSLRPNDYEETLFCMGCHSTIGTTIDHTFAFGRKIDGAGGWGYINLHGMPDAPSRGEADGEILTYLRRVGGGSEFRNNPEMQARWFRPDGTLDEAKVRRAKDVYELIAPSAERALLLNKAYRLIVREQSYRMGRDATMQPPAHVFESIDREVPPLAEQHRYTWDLRLAWPER